MQIMIAFGLSTNIMVAIIRVFANKNDVQRYEILRRRGCCQWKKVVDLQKHKPLPLSLPVDLAFESFTDGGFRYYANDMEA